MQVDLELNENSLSPGKLKTFQLSGNAARKTVPSYRTSDRINQGPLSTTLDAYRPFTTVPYRLQTLLCAQITTNKAFPTGECQFGKCSVTPASYCRAAAGRAHTSALHASRRGRCGSAAAALAPATTMTSSATQPAQCYSDMFSLHVMGP